MGDNQDGQIDVTQVDHRVCADLVTFRQNAQVGVLTCLVTYLQYFKNNINFYESCTYTIVI